MRGNVVDMAVGIVIGGAFGKIVSSLVSDVIMLPIGMVMGSVSFSDLSLVLGEGEGAATLNYGMFIDNIISFLIVAFFFFARKACAKRDGEALANTSARMIS
mgnify:CR=1 FL=1